MIGIPVQCQRCKHRHTDRRGNYCDAYPQQGSPIPRAILEMEVDHRAPYEGDRGIRWEPAKPGVMHPFDEDEEEFG